MRERWRGEEKHRYGGIKESETGKEKKKHHNFIKTLQKEKDVQRDVGKKKYPDSTWNSDIQSLGAGHATQVAFIGRTQ